MHTATWCSVHFRLGVLLHSLWQYAWQCARAFMSPAWTKLSRLACQRHGHPESASNCRPGITKKCVHGNTC
eukprot:15474566-Alexandrium_andersonii.AAC.1